MVNISVNGGTKNISRSAPSRLKKGGQSAGNLVNNDSEGIYFRLPSISLPQIPLIPIPPPNPSLPTPSQSLLHNNPKLRYPSLLHGDNMRAVDNAPLAIGPGPETPAHHAAIERGLDDAVGGEGPVRGKPGLQFRDVRVEGFAAVEG